MRDAKSKRRTARGSNNGRTSLTEEGVKQIRTLHAQGQSTGKLAQAFHLSRSAISSIVTGKTWAHAPGAIRAVGESTTQKHALPTRQRQELVALYQKGEHTMSALAALYGISQVTVSNYVRAALGPQRRTRGGKKLTKIEQGMIRKALAEGASVRSLARRFDVDRSVIHRLQDS